MRAWLLLLVVVAACKSDPHQEVCEHYAQLLAKCSADDGDRDLARSTAENFCLKGMSGKHEKIFGERYKAMIECTRTAKTCEEYEKCNAP